MSVQVYKGGAKYETFSYLPVMTADQVRRQIAYCISQGWNPSVEHTEKGALATQNYWYIPCWLSWMPATANSPANWCVLLPMTTTRKARV